MAVFGLAGYIVAWVALMIAINVGIRVAEIDQVNPAQQSQIRTLQNQEHALQLQVNDLRPSTLLTPGR
jgi:hypothetical protein